jgi:hypothetical protein
MPEKSCTIGNNAKYQALVRENQWNMHQLPDLNPPNTSSEALSTHSCTQRSTDYIIFMYVPLKHIILMPT